MNTRNILETIKIKSEVAHNDSIMNDTATGRACAYARYRAYRECLELIQKNNKNTKLNS